MATTRLQAESIYMIDDQLLAPMVDVLKKVTAFQTLPSQVLTRLASHIEISYVPRNQQILIQGETVVRHLSIVLTGALELYDEEGDESEILDEGGLFGGLSVLRNKGVSLRSVKTLEDSFLYLLPREIFIETCGLFPEVRAYFFETLTATYKRSQQALGHRRFRVKEDVDGPLLHLAVEDVAGDRPTCCGPEVTIRRAARIMTKASTGYVLIIKAGKLEGIVTDSDLRRLVIAGSITPEQPVTQVMRSPVHQIQTGSTLLEALVLMLRHKLSYLPVCNGREEVVGVLSASGLPQAQRHSLLSLSQRAQQARFPADLALVKAELPPAVRSLFQEGYGIEHITRFITQVNDLVISRLVELAVEKLGEPPCSFAFITMGSEGREEQTLHVDQDNGIVYDDPKNPTAQTYFTNLGALVCTWLDQAGYDYCKGRIMANNPKWCRPLSSWLSLFLDWITEPDAMALMHTEIFFDFRAVYGNQELAERLRDGVFAQLGGRSDLYFRLLAGRMVAEAPPTGFFRNFIVASKGEHRQTLDIKKTMNSIVEFARIFALKQGIRVTNTRQRLIQLRREALLSEHEFEELDRGYHYMMSLRLHHQDQCLIESRPVDNMINPYQLSKLDQDILKAVFKLVSQLQRRMRHHFTGPI